MTEGRKGKDGMPRGLVGGLGVVIVVIVVVVVRRERCCAVWGSGVEVGLFSRCEESCCGCGVHRCCAGGGFVDSGLERRTLACFRAPQSVELFLMVGFGRFSS